MQMTTELRTARASFAVGRIVNDRLRTSSAFTLPTIIPTLLPLALLGLLLPLPLTRLSIG